MSTQGNLNSVFTVGGCPFETRRYQLCPRFFFKTRIVASDTNITFQLKKTTAELWSRHFCGNMEIGLRALCHVLVERKVVVPYAKE